MTTSTGVVKVNEQPVKGTHTLLVGDTLYTENGKAMVNVGAGVVSLADHSTVRFERGAFELDRGCAKFSGRSKVRAGYKKLSIVADGTSPATFFIGELHGRPTVAALGGSITVSDGTHSVVLTEGQGIEAVGTDASGTGQAEPAVKGKPRPPTDEQEEQRGGKKRGGILLLPGWAEFTILAGAVAGIFTGLGLSGYFDKYSN